MLKKKHKRDFKDTSMIFKKVRAFSLAWYLGFLIVFLLGGCMLVGAIIDNYLHTSPLFLLIGTFAGIFLVIYNSYRTALSLMKDDK